MWRKDMSLHYKGHDIKIRVVQIFRFFRWEFCLLKLLRQTKDTK